LPDLGFTTPGGEDAALLLDMAGDASFARLHQVYRPPGLDRLVATGATQVVGQAVAGQVADVIDVLGCRVDQMAAHPAGAGMSNMTAGKDFHDRQCAAQRWR
jgi:hypothetical protein